MEDTGIEPVTAFLLGMLATLDIVPHSPSDMYLTRKRIRSARRQYPTQRKDMKCIATAEYRLKTMTVPPPGLEPGRMRIHWHLKPARLPFRHKSKADEVGVEPTAPVKERRFSGPAETTVPQLVHTLARVMSGEQS